MTVAPKNNLAVLLLITNKCILQVKSKRQRDDEDSEGDKVNDLEFSSMVEANEEGRTMTIDKGTVTSKDDPK